MRQIYGVLSALVMVLGLAACSTPDRSADSSWSRPSGVEILWGNGCRGRDGAAVPLGRLPRAACRVRPGFGLRYQLRPVFS